VSTETQGESTKLASNALTMQGVIFCCLAGSAPLAAVIFNVPYAVGWGGSAGASAFLLATICLTIFTVGYVEMAKRVTSAGGFYSFISHGFGQAVGLGAAFTITAAYIVFAAAQVGVFTFFLSVLTEDLWGDTLPVLPVMLGVLALVFTLAFFDVKLTSRVLGVAMITEVLCIVILIVAVFVQGGGPEGFAFGETLNPFNLQDNEAANLAGPLTGGFVTAAIGVAFFGAFWSWVGFEMAPNYAEETKNPKKAMAPAMFTMVIGLGVFYTLAAWAITSGTGPSQIGLAQAAAFNGEIPNIIYPVSDEFVGGWLSFLIKLLAVTGDFACFAAFFNTSARYVFSMGREGILPRALSRTHPVHKSPYIASIAVAIIILVWSMAFYAYDSTLLGQLFKLGTFGPVVFVFGILGIQALCSFAIIAYFWRKDREGWHWWKTGLAPLIGGVVQIPVMYIVNHESGTLGGSAPILTYMVYIVAGIFLAGVAVALYFKSSQPEKYAAIGRFVHEG
jgi:amino acid transporter